MNSRYISFVGEVLLVDNEDLLSKVLAQKENPNWADEGVAEYVGEYNEIGGRDSVSVYLNNFGDGTGHLVADCMAAGWTEDAIVKLENEKVVYASDLNPNPIPLIEIE